MSFIDVNFPLQASLYCNGVWMSGCLFSAQSSSSPLLEDFHFHGTGVAIAYNTPNE